MNLDKLITQFTIEDHPIYQNDLLRPFVQNYLTSPDKCQFKLFHRYVWKYDYWVNTTKKKIMDWYPDHIRKNHSGSKLILDNGKLNLRIPWVRRQLYDYSAAFFVGFTNQQEPIFIYFNEYCDGTCVKKYSYTGFKILKSVRYNNKRKASEWFDLYEGDPWKECGKLNSKFPLIDLPHTITNGETEEFIKSGDTDHYLQILSNKTYRKLLNHKNV